MSIMMPALSRVREQAKQITCMSNVRSIGQASMTYSGDYNGRYPLLGALGENGHPFGDMPFSPFWDARLLSYLGAQSVDLYIDWGDDPRYTGKKEDWSDHEGTIKAFICPTALYMKQKIGNPRNDENYYNRSYRYNSYIGGRVCKSSSNGIDVSKSYRNSVSVSGVNDSARTILFAESQLISRFNQYDGSSARGWFDVQPAHFVKFEGSMDRADNTWNPWGFPRSFGKSNFAFADGHAETMDTQFTEVHTYDPGFTDYPDPIDGIKFHPTRNW